MCALEMIWFDATKVWVSWNVIVKNSSVESLVSDWVKMSEVSNT